MTHIIFILVVVILPLLSVISVRRMRQNQEVIQINTLANNLSGILMLWLSLSIVIVMWLYQGGSLKELGIVQPDDSAIILSAILSILSLLLVIILARRIKLSAEFRRWYMSTNEHLDYLLPRTKAERNTFYLLSITAGICEEIIFRGFVFAYLLQYMDIFWVVIVSSVLFGLAHSYQGLKGVPVTGSIGLLLALIYVYTGSIWASMVLHALIDLGAGYLSWLAIQEKIRQPSLPV